MYFFLRQEKLKLEKKEKQITAESQQALAPIPGAGGHILAAAGVAGTAPRVDWPRRVLAGGCTALAGARGGGRYYMDWSLIFDRRVLHAFLVFHDYQWILLLPNTK